MGVLFCDGDEEEAAEEEEVDEDEEVEEANFFLSGHDDDEDDVRLVTSSEAPGVDVAVAPVLVVVPWGLLDCISEL